MAQISLSRSAAAAVPSRADAEHQSVVAAAATDRDRNTCAPQRPGKCCALPLSLSLSGLATRALQTDSRRHRGTRPARRLWSSPPPPRELEWGKIRGAGLRENAHTKSAARGASITNSLYCFQLRWSRGRTGGEGAALHKNGHVSHRARSLCSRLISSGLSARRSGTKFIYTHNSVFICNLFLCDY